MNPVVSLFKFITIREFSLWLSLLMAQQWLHEYTGSIPDEDFFLSFFFFFHHFLGCSLGIWRFSGPGLNQSCSHRPTPQPQPQQLGIQATSATYTTAHGNTGSLTHWARPWIEPATSWFLVGFANHWATTGTPLFVPCTWCHQDLP